MVWYFKHIFEKINCFVNKNIDLSDNDYSFEDLGSTEGTFKVNSDGSRVKLKSKILIFL